jgi:hypothetical protein
VTWKHGKLKVHLIHLTSHSPWLSCIEHYRVLVVSLAIAGLPGNRGSLPLSGVMRVSYHILVAQEGMQILKNGIMVPVLVAHTCNPSYSGGRDQEDHGLRLAQANSLRNLISKIPYTKKGW